MSNKSISRCVLAIVLAAGLTGASPALAKPHRSWQEVWDRLTREVTATLGLGGAIEMSRSKRAATVSPDGISPEPSPTEPAPTGGKPVKPENGG